MRRYFALRLFAYNLPVSLFGALFLVLATADQLRADPGKNALTALLAFALTRLALVLPSLGFGLSWLLYARNRGHEFPLFFNLGIPRRQLAVLAWSMSLAAALAFFGISGALSSWPA